MTPDPASSVIWAMYAQDEFAILHKLTLSAGVRYDHYSIFGGTTNPRLGLIYHLSRLTALKVLYGTAFRAPEPYELAPDFGSFYDDNLHLGPEKIRTIEGVLEQALGSHFTLSGSVFRNQIRDLISLETRVNNGQWVYRNSDRANATGVEVEFDARFAGGLEGTASYSYIDTEDAVTHQILSNSPQHLGKLNLAVPMLRRRLFASFDAQYTSPRQTLAGNSVSGFSVFNVTLLAHTLSKHLDCSASIYNMFDKKYFDPGRPEDPQDSIQQDGRNFRIKLTGRF